MNSGPATNTDAAWLVGLLQAGDSFYPTGGYAHSFGLEGLVQLGVVRDRATLREFFLLSALPTLRGVELPLAAQAYAALIPNAPDWVAVAELSKLAHALKSPRELRQATENIGRQRAELTVRLHAHPLAVEYAARAAAEGWPHAAAVAAALEGRVLGAPCEAVLAGMTYATLSATLAAAMKLLRLGQNAGQTLLTEMLGHAPELIATARATPRDEIGWFNPWLDIAAARHETADARMFIS
jgi:urease accessory protein